MGVPSSFPPPGRGGGGGGFKATMDEDMTPTSILPLLGGGKFKDRLRQNADLSKTNWFRVGGSAQFLFKPEDTQDLSAFLAFLPMDSPVTVLAVGSTVILPAAAIDGALLNLGR